MDRRAFVKASVACACAAGACGAAAALTVPLARPRPAPDPPVPYLGLHRVGGPAPRGVPLVPLAVNARGELEGVAVLDGVPAASSLAPGPDGRVDVLPWLRYCGHENAPGLSHAWKGDDVLRYHVRAGDPWYAPLAGEPLRPEHFDAPGKGAAFTWRSEGQRGADLVTGVVVRLAAPPASPARLVPPARRPRGADLDVLAARFLADGTLLAASTYCTHFCCTPGYRESAEAEREGFADALYCTCHGSAFEPREVAVYEMSPEKGDEN